jgi:hypothetical protein
MKKYLWIATLLALLTCSALAVPVQSGWKEYVYAEDGFAISAPIQPTVQTESKDTPVGPVDAHNYVVDLGNDIAIGVNATDFKMGQGIDAKLVLAATKAGLAESLQAKIISEKEISLGSEPGLELELSTDSNHMRFRYFFIEGKLFALMSTAPLAKPFAPETTRMFDSFRLVGGKRK